DVEDGKEKLEIIGNLSLRMIEKAGKPINLSWTLDRKAAWVDADFVSTQIRVGGLEAREKDERIPLSHVHVGQEANGAGVVFKANRTVAVLMELAEDIQVTCPDDWVINFTNAIGIGTEALLDHSPHEKVIEVCNVPFNV